MKKRILRLSVITLAAIAAGCGIDIKPGVWPNTVNVNSKGVLQVALLYGEDIYGPLDIYAIDPGSAELWEDETLLAAAIPGKFSYTDVNGDGHADLLVSFQTRDVVPHLSTTVNGTELQLCVIADTTQQNIGEATFGCDSIVIINKVK